MEIKEVLETGLILTGVTWTMFGIYDKFISKSLSTSSINDSPFKGNSTVDIRKQMTYNSDNGIIGETNNSIPSIIPVPVPDQSFMSVDEEGVSPIENHELMHEENGASFESFMPLNDNEEDVENNLLDFTDQEQLENRETIEFFEPMTEQNEEEQQDLPDYVEIFEDYESEYTSEEAVDLVQLNEYNPYLTTSDYSIEAI